MALFLTISVLFWKRSRWALILVVLALLSFGCSRTVIGGFSDSPDKKVRVYGRCFGPIGRDYVVLSQKIVRITIVSNDLAEADMFSKDYRVHGAGVGWRVTWGHSKDLSIIIFDFGDAVTYLGPETNEPSKRILKRLSFQRDAATGLYKEQVAK